MSSTRCCASIASCPAPPMPLLPLTLMCRAPYNPRSPSGTACQSLRCTPNQHWLCQRTGSRYSHTIQVALTQTGRPCWDTTQLLLLATLVWPAWTCSMRWWTATAGQETAGSQAATTLWAPRMVKAQRGRMEGVMTGNSTYQLAALFQGPPLRSCPRCMLRQMRIHQQLLVWQGALWPTSPRWLLHTQQVQPNQVPFPTCHPPVTCCTLMEAGPPLLAAIKCQAPCACSTKRTQSLGSCPLRTAQARLHPQLARQWGARAQHNCPAQQPQRGELRRQAQRAGLVQAAVRWAAAWRTCMRRRTCVLRAWSPPPLRPKERRSWRRHKHRAKLGILRVRRVAAAVGLQHQQVMSGPPLQARTGASLTGAKLLQSRQTRSGCPSSTSWQWRRQPTRNSPSSLSGRPGLRASLSTTASSSVRVRVCGTTASSVYVYVSVAPPQAVCMCVCVTTTSGSASVLFMHRHKQDYACVTWQAWIAHAPER
mmetsp:Transcript_17003/g.47084  ORF Transcript_17003/g.47084 Transcript_17003/m.47084 type:complete len:480 (-) Transcript_17003:53-1492(-)